VLPDVVTPLTWSVVSPLPKFLLRMTIGRLGVDTDRRVILTRIAGIVIILFGLFRVLPSVQTLLYSFYKVELLRDRFTFIRLENFYSLFEDETFRISEDLDLVHVVDPFATETATYGLAYLRLHGSPPGPVMYRYSYTDADLKQIRTVCHEYDDALVLFNNITMHADARRFRALVTPVASG
jgi:ABC-type sugar transport system permease subunit